MAKQTTSVRLPASSLKQIQDLSELFQESNSKIVERAVSMLYENRESALRQYVEERLKKFEESKNK
ncbi:hypothetical protein [Larkinella soli]|uniref:hypothetical protein n=1 Tax=Larkinella soli TaxID=1770527 RepID=UPI0019D1CC52|nr:hypothetical protein [Larkinella soli]